MIFDINPRQRELEAQRFKAAKIRVENRIEREIELLSYIREKYVGKHDC